MSFLNSVLNKEKLNFYDISLLTIRLSAVMFILYAFFGTKNILENTQQKEDVLFVLKESLEHKRNSEIELAKNTKKSDPKIDYHLSSIYAYSMLYNKDIDIIKKKSKFNDYESFEIVIKGAPDKTATIDFAKDFRKLGYVESIAPNKITMHVKNVDTNDVRKALKKQGV